MGQKRKVLTQIRCIWMKYNIIIPKKFTWPPRRPLGVVNGGIYPKICYADPLLIENSFHSDWELYTIIVNKELKFCQNIETAISEFEFFLSFL